MIAQRFKNGDSVRRIKGENPGQYEGYEGVIESIGPETYRGDQWLNFPDGTRGFSRSFELVQPTGPVVIETVTKTRIVPGTYDGVTVWENPRGKIEINFHLGDPTPDQLDAAAAVLSALAKGLRDA